MGEIVSPLRGFGSHARAPTASAVGYVVSPLRGSADIGLHPAVVTRPELGSGELRMPTEFFLRSIWLIPLFPLAGAATMLLIGRRHPPIYDAADLGVERRRLGRLALIVFLLCFSYAPIATGGF